MEKKENESSTISTTQKRTFFTEGPPSPFRHYMVPVNDSKIEELLTFFTTNDRNRGAAVKFCAVYGPHQGGKSARRGYITAALENSDLLVVNIHMRAVSSTPSDFYCSLAKRIDRALRNHVCPYTVFPANLTCVEFQRLFEPEGSFATLLQETNKTGLLLLIESMSSLCCIEEFWSGISPMLKANQDVIEASTAPVIQFPNILRGVVGFGVHRIARDSNRASSSPNKVDIQVPHFTKEQVNEYLWQPAERDYNFKITDGAKELLFEFIRGHPGLTCRAGSKILNLVLSTNSPPFLFTPRHAVSILHSIIRNSGHETPLNDLVKSLDYQFESGKHLKDVLRSLLLESSQPNLRHATKELFFAIDKGIFRIVDTDEGNQGTELSTTDCCLEFECPIVIMALLQRIFEINPHCEVFKHKIVKCIPNEFHLLLGEFTRRIDITALKEQQMSCSETSIEAAYYFQFYLFLSYALSNDYVLAKLHPWKVKGQEKTTICGRCIDLYVDEDEFHFKIELKQTEAFHGSELWKEADQDGNKVFRFVVTHDSEFIKWEINRLVEHKTAESLAIA